MKDIQNLSVYQKFIHCIETHKLLQSDSNVVLGVSGGADSVCMLLLFYAYLPVERLIVAHLNHGIRGEEARCDEEFVRVLCEKLGVRYVSEYKCIPALAANDGMGIEETARKYRYEFFHRIAEREHAVIAVAHNKDDRAETILMNIARGCSVDGLRGIAYQHGRVIRPILDLSRVEIESFCKFMEVDFVIDSTNLQDCTIRNKVRHHGIPMLRELFQQDFTEKLIQLSDFANKDANFLDHYTKQKFDSIVNYQQDTQVYRLDRTTFSQEDEAIQYRLVRMILSSLQDKRNGGRVYPDGKDLTRDTIERMVVFLRNGHSGRCIEGGKCTYCLIEHTHAVFYVETPDTINGTISDMEFLQEEIARIDLHGKEIWKHKSDWEEYFDRDVIERLCSEKASELKIRPIDSGDRFIPFGCHGHTTVQKFLIDKKIPLSQRNQIKVLCIDDEIIWIPGLRRSEIGRITEDTQQIIKLTIKSEALSYGTNKQNGCN